MRGPSLEAFKFGLYLFFPIFIMVQVGDPGWYKRHVIPYKDRLFPREEDTYKPPTDRAALRAELERLKARKIARRQEHEKDSQMETSPYNDDERLV